MKNSLNYLKKLFKVLIWPIIFTIGSFFISYIFVAIFNSNEQGNLTNKEFLEYIKTIEYQNRLNDYINSNALIIAIITTLIFIPILCKVYKKYKKQNNFNLKDIMLPISLGITISLIYNITVFNLNNIFHFTNNYEITSIPIIIEIICSGIIGPILEELVFRGIVYNKLKEFNKPMTAMILTSIIFGLIHNNIVNAIYAFGVSFIFIYLYEKHKTLKSPILMHMTLNITIIFMLRLILFNFTLFNMYLLIVSIIILLIIKKLYINMN